MEMSPVLLYNEEEISRAVFGDTDEGGQTCIICYNLCGLQSSQIVLDQFVLKLIQIHCIQI
jgi:hypothetical protein